MQTLKIITDLLQALAPLVPVITLIVLAIMQHRGVPAAKQAEVQRALGLVDVFVKAANQGVEQRKRAGTWNEGDAQQTKADVLRQVLAALGDGGKGLAKALGADVGHERFLDSAVEAALVTVRGAAPKAPLPAAAPASTSESTPPTS